MIPEQYGGSFSDVTTYGLLCEELARVDWVIASVVSVSNSLVATLDPPPRDARRRRSAGSRRSRPARCLTSACLTEPGGGTDLPNMRTTAT